MESTAVTELETAAQILLAPPNLVNGQQRHSAESVFLNFRKTVSPFVLCRHILESSKVDYVLFEAAGLLRDGLIREWGRLEAADIKQLRSYLMDYVISNVGLSSFVREGIVQVIAIIVKRQSVEDLGRDRQVVIGQVKQLIVGGSLQAQLVGCSVLSSMMQEYATTVKSSDVGLPWEVHFRTKKQFELTDLISIFQFCVQALKEFSPSLVTVPIPAEKHTLVLRFCTLAESVLSWNFINVNLPRKLISVFESDQNPSLRPGTPWKGVMLDPELTMLFFEIYMKVRRDSELSHHTLNCLVQLASLNGTVMTKKEARLGYLTNYLTHFLKLVEKLESIGSMQPMEALGCSNITRRIMIFFPPSLLANLDATLLERCLKKITTLTCHFMKVATDKSQLVDDSTIYAEAFEYMLQSWVSVLHEKDTFPADLSQEFGVEVFNTYVRCNLSAPDGFRERDKMAEDDDDDEITESEESDRVKYKETLATIGALGRLAPNHSIPVLTDLLEKRVSRLHGQIRRLIDQGTTTIDKPLSSLYDDLHWILLIAGNVLTLDTEGEPTMIPSDIMQYSLEQMPRVNVETSLRLLASPDKHMEDIPGHESTDPVVRLISGVFRLSEMERLAAEAGFSVLLSPEVASSIMWFLRRYVLTYLSAQETFYTEISLAIVSAFGQNSEGAAWITNFLLGKVTSNLTLMHSEPDVVRDTIHLLLSLVDGKERGRQVLKSEVLLSLIDLGASNDGLRKLPSEAKRGLMKALVLVASTFEDQASRGQYWQKVMEPLIARYIAMINTNDIKKRHCEEDVKRAFVNIIESLIGATQGIHSTTAQQIFLFLQPTMTSLVELMGLYHNYPELVELVLEFYCEVARRCLCYLNQADSKFLYQRSIAAIEMYAMHNNGKKTVGKDAEEDQFRDLLLLMELLTNLLSKDFIDLAPHEPHPSLHEGLTAGDVCLHGLNVVMPLMSVELLKFPSLCLHYFKVATLVCELYPDKICNLDHALQKNLLSSLEVGLTAACADTVYILCCEFLQVLAGYLFRSKHSEVPIYEALRPFLKLLMDLVLSQKINSDLIQTSSSTLYILICCYQNTYRELVQYLIDSQANADNKRRLVDAFAELTQNLPLTSERVHRMRFRDNFDRFIVAVRGFLFVK